MNHLLSFLIYGAPFSSLLQQIVENLQTLHFLSEITERAANPKKRKLTSFLHFCSKTDGNYYCIKQLWINFHAIKKLIKISVVAALPVICLDIHSKCVLFVFACVKMETFST